MCRLSAGQLLVINMNIKVKFKVSDKLVKARDGAGYSLANYVEGVDYVMRGCFKGKKAVFRADILGVSVVDPSLVEHKQEPQAVRENCPEVEVVSAQVDVQPEDWRPSAPAKEVLQEPKLDVQACKIVRIYPNFKWVETDKGRVWVGLKGSTMKAGQVIQVKNGELYLGKTTSSSMVRI